MKTIYVAGRFSPTKQEMEEIAAKEFFKGGAAETMNIEYIIRMNVLNAAHAGALLAVAGEGRYFPVVPHTMTAQIWRKVKGLEPESDLCRSDSKFWYEGSLRLLEFCDAIVMLPGWEESKGAEAERRYAIADGLAYAEFNEISLNDAERVIRELK